MELIADILLISGAFGAGIYCIVLSRRLNKFNNLETGMGGAIAVLSAQVDDMTKALENARSAAGEQTTSLDASTERAEQVAKHLELLVAAMHDLPETPPSPKNKADIDQPESAEPSETPQDDQVASPEATFLRHRQNYQEAAE